MVMQDLEALANAFGAKRKAGTVQAHGSGFGGSGFKFDAAEDERHNNERKVRSMCILLPVSGST